MPLFGKSIRIYLKDGTVTGIKIGEVVNQTIQAISCPRNRIVELKSSIEANKPGIYFLFGIDETSGENMAYIGESENVFERLQNHFSGKDFWSDVILFVSKDENLTKSHVKFLESRIIQAANEIKRYKIENGNQSQASSLPPADRDAMEEFLTYIKLLLGVLGHKLLEELAPTNTKILEKTTNGINAPNIVTDLAPFKNIELSLNVGGIKASSLYTDEGIVVLEGSYVAQENQPSLSNGYKEIRQRLINNGILKLDSSKYIFTSKYLFDSPSQAAAIIVGYAINGRATWKDKMGRSLNEIENQQIKLSTY